jgi:predicted amidohydrolase
MRKSRIGSVSFLVEDKKQTINQNVEKCFYYIEEAQKNNLDFLCFPESVLTQNTKEADRAKNNIFPIEEYPGKFTKMICEKANQANLNIIFPNYIKASGIIYNQATIISRKGEILGFYRKIQPTYTESKSIKSGDNINIITVDKIKIGVILCFDIYFPEIIRIYSYKGLELLFWPTLTHGPTQTGLEAQFKSRAIDNSVHIVQSNIACLPPYAPYSGRYQPGKASIVDPNGDVIADTGRKDGICFADIDFDDERLTSFVIGKSEPDHFRKDMESLVRLDLYQKEYKKISGLQKTPRRACPEFAKGSGLI